MQLLYLSYRTRTGILSFTTALRAARGTAHAISVPPQRRGRARPGAHLRLVCSPRVSSAAIAMKCLQEFWPGGAWAEKRKKKKLAYEDGIMLGGKRRDDELRGGWPWRQVPIFAEKATKPRQRKERQRQRSGGAFALAWRRDVEGWKAGWEGQPKPRCHEREGEKKKDSATPPSG